MSWAIAFHIASADFDVINDPIGGFPTKAAAVDEVIGILERQRRDLSRAMRKARQMRRRAKG